MHYLRTHENALTHEFLYILYIFLHIYFNMRVNLYVKVFLFVHI